MGERISAPLYDELASSIWELSKLSMQHLIVVAPIPSYVKRDIENDEICLEPECYVSTVAEQNLREMPRVLGLTVNSKGPFGPNDSLTLYEWRTISLDRPRRSRNYSSGLLISDSLGSEIRPQLDKPAPWQTRRPGNQEWRELRANGNLDGFGPTDAIEFIDLAKTFTARLKQEARDRESE